jgi:diketogulonate reductase-like aldo/keto reductase
VLPWCARNGVAVVAYSPFGHNDFPAPASPGGKLLQKIADAHKSTPRQVALAFLTRESTVFTIPKAGSAEHAAENAGAGTLALSDSEITALDAAFPRGAKPRSLPML